MMRSFKKKILSLKKKGISPLLEGYNNYNKEKKEVEVLAKKRSIICEKCNDFVKEPCVFLRVLDTKIPVLSEKMCDICGCTASYKLRQSIKKCKKWEE